MRLIAAAALAAALALPAAAGAASFHLTYTTDVDATSGPSVQFDATLTTDDGEFYGPGSYAVLSISGTRGGQAVSFDPAQLFNDRIFYPGPSGTGGFVDTFGLDFLVGGQVYNLRKQSTNEPFYRENDGGTDRLIGIRNLSLTPSATTSPVPEPASWAMMVAGFGLLGAGLRRRTSAVVAPA